MEGILELHHSMIISLMMLLLLPKGLEYDPERGHRCTECFDMRMERTALYAHENGFDAIATTNSTSRWKDAKQVDDSGLRCASKYKGLKYWSHNWQSDEMTMRKYQVREKLKCNDLGFVDTLNAIYRFLQMKSSTSRNIVDVHTPCVTRMNGERLMVYPRSR